MPLSKKTAMGAVVAAIAIATGSLALLAAHDRTPSGEALPDTPAGDQSRGSSNR